MKITKSRCGFEREPLIAPFGFKVTLLDSGLAAALQGVVEGTQGDYPCE